MQKYMKKSSGLVVEAIQLKEDNTDIVANWCQGQIVVERDALAHDQIFEGINVKTPEGKKRASRGMYVIKMSDKFFVGGESEFGTMYELIK